jgi:hypothetical protein
MSRNWTILLWREKTWGERAQTVLANILVGLMGLGMLFGVLWVLGRMIDHADQYSVEHDRCLKNATNGLEIKRCR